MATEVSDLFSYFLYFWFTNFMEMIKCYFCFNTVVWEIMSDGL